MEARRGLCALVFTYDSKGNLINVWEKICPNARALRQSSNDALRMQQVSPEYALQFRSMPLR